jgi:hypothetical protein
MLLIFAPFLFKTVLMEDHADVEPILSKFSVFCFCRIYCRFNEI